MKLRLLLVDDHRMFLDMLQVALEAQEDFEVLAAVGSGQEALEAAKRDLPDLVLMDYELAQESGAQLARQLIGQHPGLKVLALSSHTEPEVVAQMLGAGAMGYLDKSAPVSQLLEVIRLAMGHRVYLCPDFEAVSRLALQGPAQGPDERLNEKEVEIIRLLAEGFSSKEISARLDLTTKTVDVYRQKIRGLLGLDSVAELTKYALKTGLTTLE